MVNYDVRRTRLKKSLLYKYTTTVRRTGTGKNTTTYTAGILYRYGGKNETGGGGRRFFLFKNG